MGTIGQALGGAGLDEVPARLLEVILDTIPDSVFIKDRDKRFVLVNRASCETIGHPREWFPGRTSADFLSPEDARECAESEDRVLKGETVCEEVIKVIQERVLVFEIAWAPIRSEDGAVTHIIGTARDVTARTELKNELLAARDRERKLRMELDHRVRNNLASLSELIRITTARAGCAHLCLNAIQSRIDAIREMHALLSGRQDAGVDLRDVVVASTPPGLRSRLVWHGEPLSIPASAVVPMGMVLAELSTNAEKHGAWSEGCQGRVEVSWCCAGEPGAIVLEWTERNGPPAAPPEADGVGLDLIRGFVESDLRGTANLTFAEAGASHRMTVRFGTGSAQEPKPCG